MSSLNNDVRLRQLQQQKERLLSKASTPEVTAQIKSIDAQIAALK